MISLYWGVERPAFPRRAAMFRWRRRRDGKHASLWWSALTGKGVAGRRGGRAPGFASRKIAVSIRPSWATWKRSPAVWRISTTAARWSGKSRRRCSSSRSTQSSSSISSSRFRIETRVGVSVCRLAGASVSSTAWPERSSVRRVLRSSTRPKQYGSLLQMMAG